MKGILIPHGTGPVEDTRFDRWLSRKLHAVYDDSLHEPLPAELAQLMQLFDAPTGETTEATAETSAGAAAGPDSSTRSTDAGEHGRQRHIDL